MAVTMAPLWAPAPDWLPAISAEVPPAAKAEAKTRRAGSKMPQEWAERSAICAWESSCRASQNKAQPASIYPPKPENRYSLSAGLIPVLIVPLVTSCPLTAIAYREDTVLVQSCKLITMLRGLPATIQPATS